MSAAYTAEEIIDLTLGRMAQGMTPEDAGEIVTDTRSLMEGKWFVALVGKNFDGHDFIGDAFCGGALGCIVEDRGSYPIAATSFPLIAVDDTEEALGALVTNWRKRTRKKVVLVTAPDRVQTTELAHELARMHGETAEFAAGDDAIYQDWRVNASEILCGFLNIGDDVDYVVADFAPQPLARAPWLVERIKPDIIVCLPDAWQYDRLSGDHHLPGEIMREIIGVVERYSPPPGQKTVSRRGTTLVTTDRALAEELGLVFVENVAGEILA